MTSSRIVAMIPPWVIPSQPSNRSSSTNSVHDARCGSRWSDQLQAVLVLSVAAGEAVVRLERERPERDSRTTRASDVKVLHLAGLGLDEVLARRDLLAHQHREDLVGAAAFSLSTRRSVRVSGFIVVSQSCSAFISPRPLKRWTETFLTFICLTIASRSFSDWAYLVTLPVLTR
jgi:hypothetical protein